MPSQLRAVDMSVPPAKKVNIMLKDGRAAADVNGHLFIDEDGKLVPAPPGSYVATNGIVWTVDATGRVHTSATAAAAASASSGAFALHGPLQPAPTSQMPAPQVGARNLENVPDVLKGLKIFLPGKSGNVVPYTRKMKIAKFKAIPSLAQNMMNPDQTAPNGGNTTKVVFTPGQPFVDAYNYLEYTGASSSAMGPTSDNYLLFFLGNTNNTPADYASSIEITFSPALGAYYLVDVSLYLETSTPTSVQIKVSGPDGSAQTLPGTPPDSNGISHVVFGYYAQHTGTAGETTFQISVSNVDWYIFSAASVSPVAQ